MASLRRYVGATVAEYDRLYRSSPDTLSSLSAGGGIHAAPAFPLANSSPRQRLGAGDVPAPAFGATTSFQLNSQRFDPCEQQKSPTDIDRVVAPKAGSLALVNLPHRAITRLLIRWLARACASARPAFFRHGCGR